MPDLAKKWMRKPLDIDFGMAKPCESALGQIGCQAPLESEKHTVFHKISLQKKFHIT